MTHSPSFLRALLQKEDEQREGVIKQSRDVLKLSKNAIYSLHRGEVDRATKQLEQAESIAKTKVLPLVEGYPRLRLMGSMTGCLEEFAEAKIFQHFLKEGNVLPYK